MICLDTLGTVALRAADGAELRTVLTQPKRLALLCYLAVESSRGYQRRDHLFALFWPELTQLQARQALRQALYFLRRELSDRVIANRGAEEIRIASDVIECDVHVLTTLLDHGRLEEALARYRGNFLEGLFVRDTSNAFQRWLDATREQLRRRALDAAWALSGAAERRGDPHAAAHWARYANRLAPDDERSLQRLVRIFDLQGDRAGALHAYAEFAKWLAVEFDAVPSAETGALIEAVRSRTVVGEYRA